MAKKNNYDPTTSSAPAGRNPRFMECMAPNQLHGTGIRTVQQAGAQANMAFQRERRERLDGMGYARMPMSMQDHERRMKMYDAVEKSRKIGNKGGSTFQRGDILDRG